MLDDSSRITALKWLLRFGGLLTGSAFFATILPVESMASIHEWLGMGELPRTPIVEYLARSVAAFYGFHGVLLFLVAVDPVRLRPVVIYLAVFNIVFGAFLVAIDLKAGLPSWWTAAEGPPIIVIGTIILLLNPKEQA